MTAPAKSYHYFVPSTDGSIDRAGALAKDWQRIEALLALGTVKGRTGALAVYTNGAFCQSIAHISLSSPLDEDLPSETAITATTASSPSAQTMTIQGVLHKAASVGDTSIQVRYILGSDQDTDSICSVGGNPSPQIENCFAPSGKLEVKSYSPSMMFEYDSYSPLSNTSNGVSFKSLSTNYQNADGSGEGNQSSGKVETYSSAVSMIVKAYIDYYDTPTFADEWIRAAFDGGATNFPNGNADFSHFSAHEGQDTAIKLGTLTMNVWLQVVVTMEKAIQECKSSSSNDFHQAVALWDDAVAFYSGMGGAADGSLDLLHHIAEEYCKKFGTCGPKTNVNQNLLPLWNQGRDELVVGNCNGAEARTEQILPELTIPLVQGLFFHTYEFDVRQRQSSQQVQAEVATFAAALLPRIYKCSQGNADLIHFNTKLQDGMFPSFAVVKGALERQYDCLGITCNGVGGIVDVGNPSSYARDAEPCDYSKISKHDQGNTDGDYTGSKNTAFAVSTGNRDLMAGLRLGGLLIAALFLVVISCRLKHRIKYCNGKEFDSSVESKTTIDTATPMEGICDNDNTNIHSDSEML